MLIKILRTFNTLAAVRVAMHIHKVLKLVVFITFFNCQEKKNTQPPELVRLKGDYMVGSISVIQLHNVVFYTYCNSVHTFFAATDNFFQV